MVTLQDIHKCIAFWKRDDFPGDATPEQRELVVAELQLIAAKLAERN